MLLKQCALPDAIYSNDLHNIAYYCIGNKFWLHPSKKCAPERSFSALSLGGVYKVFVYNIGHFEMIFSQKDLIKSVIDWERIRETNLSVKVAKRAAGKAFTSYS